MTSIQYLHTAAGLAASISRWVALAGDLLPLLAIPLAAWGLRLALQLVDTIARAAAITHQAGRLCGRAWFTYGVPAVLRTADAISWFISTVDWAEALSITRQGLVITASAGITASQLAIPTLCAASERLGHSYARLLVGTTTPQQPAPQTLPAAPVAPSATRRSHRPALDSLRVVELRQLARQRGFKTAGGRRIAQATKQALLALLAT